LKDPRTIEEGGMIYLKTNGRKEECWGKREKMAGVEFLADFILPRVGYSRVLLHSPFLLLFPYLWD
jgi:hypothetical protein